MLAVDIGNTNIVLSDYDNGEWGPVYRIKTKSHNSISEVQSYLKTIRFDRDVVSSVVPNITGSVVDAIRTAGKINPVVISKDINTGLDNESIPDELGSDILCNFIAAHKLYPNDYVTVADFGTAFTTETVSPEGKVIGVTIGPGMFTSVKALFETTAKLPQIRLDSPETILGRDTISAIRAGVLYGFVGQLKGIVEQIEKEIGQKVILIATGGFSKYLAGFIYVNKIDVKHTLEGARIACEMNS